MQQIQQYRCEGKVQGLCQRYKRIFNETIENNPRIWKTLDTQINEVYRNSNNNDQKITSPNCHGQNLRSSGKKIIVKDVRGKHPVTYKRKPIIIANISTKISKGQVCF